MKSLTISLIGNPNSGKTTLFNQLTGSRQHVGNWPGVTVEKNIGYFTTSKYNIQLIDLPGTYSLTTISEQIPLDEQIAYHYIFSGQPDMLINVIDATNLERHLYLTIQLIELGIPFLVALNMLDIAKNQNIRININKLQTRLSCPVIPLISTRAEGINELKLAIDQYNKNIISTIIHYPNILLAKIKKITQIINDNKFNNQQCRLLALQVLESDIHNLKQSIIPTNKLSKIQTYLKSQKTIEPEIIIADTRYRTITNICKECINIKNIKQNTLTQSIDNIVLNRWFGLPIFIFIMYMMFIISINIGGALQPIFSGSSETIFIHGIQWIGHNFNLPQWFIIFFAHGIGVGINTILPLIPQISLMYLFLSILENSGYMARVAFIMDRLMQILGLPGKSFVPLIVGFGCNVPSIMGSRILDTARERLITILMTPFMSCSARLAIFIVFATSFFGKSGASVIFSLYLLGILIAILTGLLLKYTIAQGISSHFIMELPIYHVPHLKTLFLQTWQRLKDFILKGGKIIIAASIIIAILNKFSLSGKVINDIHQSALASISKSITPILKPIGINNDNWQATVGLITGVLAKEVIIGTLNALYTAENSTKSPLNINQFNLLEQIKKSFNETWYNLKEIFSLNILSNPIKANANKVDSKIDSNIIITMATRFGSNLSAYSYLIFVLLYVPCASVLGAIAKETNRNWMIFSIIWCLNIAYSVATLFYQIVTFTQHKQYSAIIISLIIAFNTIIIILLRYLRNRIQIYNHIKIKNYYDINKCIQNKCCSCRK